MRINYSETWAELGPLLASCSRRWRKILDARLQAHNLSEATAAPLVILLRQGDHIAQSLLAERVGIEGQSLVRILDDLETDGLVDRIAHPSDRRVKLVCLTTPGKRAAVCAERCAASVRETLLADLEPGHLAATTNLLRALAEKTATFDDPAQP